MKNGGTGGAGLPETFGPECPLMRTWKTFARELAAGSVVSVTAPDRGSEHGAFMSVLLVRSGSVEVSTDGVKTVVGSSHVLCSSGRRIEAVSLSPVSRVASAVFLPGVVNGNFFGRDVLDPASSWTEPEKLDLWLLDPFLKGGNRGLLSLPAPLVERAFSLFNEIGAYLSDPANPFRACLSRTALFELLFLLRRCAVPGEGAFGTEHDPDPLVAEVLLYLGGNLHSRVSLQQLSSRFAVNRTTLSRRFRERTGKTVHEFLTEQRLILAERIVRETKIPLYEVPGKIGLEDATHFIRLFKRRYRETPKRYRDGLSGIDRSRKNAGTEPSPS